MEWTQSLRSAIEYIEIHLLKPIDIEGTAKAAHISALYLKKAFKVMTGYSIEEYVRFRRLYLAALDVVAGREKVIDLSLKYGYETPESFSKAFCRFHGVSPTRLRENPKMIRTFLPFRITVSIKGGDDIDYVVDKMGGFKVIGFERVCKTEKSFSELPGFWDEVRNKYFHISQRSNCGQSAIEKVINDCNVGEYAVCFDDEEQKYCCYLIAGRYSGQEIPEGMKVYNVPEQEWAKFRCVGPMPGAMQVIYRKIFREWLPGNLEYEIAMGCNIEWYSKGNNWESDYESEIWIPVKRRYCQNY